MPKDKGFEFEVLRNYDTLQRVIRTPDYERLCKNLTFDDDGFAEIDTTVLVDEESTSRQEKCLKEIRKRFGLIQPVQPSLILEHKQSPEFFSQIPIFEKDPYACRLVFQSTTEDTRPQETPQPVFPGSEEDGVIVSSPIHDEHYLIVDIDLLAQAKAIKSAVKEYLDEYREHLPMGLNGAAAPIFECRYLAEDRSHAEFKINLLSLQKNIFREIEKYAVTPKNRIHFEKRNGCYAVWDARKQLERTYATNIAKRGAGCPPNEISFWKIVASKLRLKEDQARKRFVRACELIAIRGHREPTWKEMRRNYLIEKARSLTGQEQVEAYEELLKLDEVGLREQLLTEKKWGRFTEEDAWSEWVP